MTTITQDDVVGRLVSIDGVAHYRIDGLEHLEPFLTTVVSDDDLWMFVSSSGALTAGRIDADHALFPYDTDDAIHRGAGKVGPASVVVRRTDAGREVWRPFAAELDPGCSRSIAKSVLGDRLVFEEVNHRWRLRWRATWAPSPRFGWVRTVELADEGGVGADVEVLDALLDVMPAGVDAPTEQLRSNLVDAYKRAEVVDGIPLALFGLEALITDRAEPAEALTTTCAWTTGFEAATIDLDERAVHDAVFDRAHDPTQLVTGRPGAFVVHGPVTLAPGGEARWRLVVDTGLAHAEVDALVRLVATHDPASLDELVDQDLALGSDRLRELLATADGFQTTADPVADAHHLSNVLFNGMRGGIFPHGHQVPTDDLHDFVRTHDRPVAERQTAWFARLDPWCHVADVRRAAADSGDADLERLVLEYLPLTFSRRHGDPSRPWNRFTIRVRGDDGGALLAYEGNWRDIFQNWEASLRSFPEYHAHVVAKFVDASTVDGHNPYRISRDGIDWEVPDPHDPWSHIGYWGDHQIVYLLRLLESWRAHDPEALASFWNRAIFTFADVPYTLADHDEMVRDPRHTIDFDQARAAEVERRVAAIGADGRLVVDPDGRLVHVGLGEKLVVPALAKLGAFVPGSGIWMNTQRPEWNDANNALAGPGLSVVTLAHLVRYVRFVDDLVATSGTGSTAMTRSVATWLRDTTEVLAAHDAAGAADDDRLRRRVLDELGGAATAHRRRARSGFDPTIVEIADEEIRRWCAEALEHLTTSLVRARRPDGLYHSYDVVDFPDDHTATVEHLAPMLEGQVAVLTSGALQPDAAADLIDALFASPLHRTDLDTFVLYPADRPRPFVERNVVPDDPVWDRIGEEAAAIVATSPDGTRRFRPELVNDAALGAVLDTTHVSPDDRAEITELYERTFGHRRFTGRSSSMYGYEGLGSVYWHMVAKLLVAVQETIRDAVDDGADDHTVERLRAGYRRIRRGLGFCKTPAEFGAFPTDCYSHTPAHAGAQQPGMTGQVKEEILTRLGELGIQVVEGRLRVAPDVLSMSELVGDDPRSSVAGFTLCGVAMTLEPGPEALVELTDADGAVRSWPSDQLPVAETARVFARDGSVARVRWVTARA